MQTCELCVAHMWCTHAMQTTLLGTHALCIRMHCLRCIPHAFAGHLLPTAEVTFACIPMLRAPMRSLAGHMCDVLRSMPNVCGEQTCSMHPHAHPPIWRCAIDPPNSVPTHTDKMAHPPLKKALRAASLAASLMAARSRSMGCTSLTWI